MVNSTPVRRTGAIVGAGAQGRITAIVWRRAEPERKLVFLDDNQALWNTQVDGVTVTGSLNSASDSLGDAEALAAIGHNRIRLIVAEKLRAKGARFANVIDPSAVIMPDAMLGVGIFVGPQAVVHIAASIGDHAIINTGVIVEHDCVVATGANLSPGVRMGGRVIIEKNCFIGVGATLAPRVVIGEGAIVGAGAVVTRNVPTGCVAYGSPARAIREAADEDWQRLF